MKKRVSISFIIFAVLFVTIGFSTFTNDLLMGASAVFRLSDELRVTEFTVEEATNGGMSNWDDYNVNHIMTGIVLPSQNSTVTYRVNVANLSAMVAQISSINNLPSNITYELIDYNLGDHICNGSTCKLGVIKEFYIKFKYTTNGYDATNNPSGNYVIDAELAWSHVYTVSFNSNNGTAPSFSSKEVTYDTQYGTLPTTTRVGYSFLGWYTLPSGGTRVQTSTLVSIGNDHTLYAHWNPDTYEITLVDLMGGGDPITVYEVYDDGFYDEDFEPFEGYGIPESNDYYDFKGYFLDQNGSGADPIVDPTGEFTVPPTYFLEDTTLFAYYEAKIFKIVFNNQGATSSGTTTAWYQYGKTKIINGVVCRYYTDSTLTTCLTNGNTITLPTKNNFNFGGYYPYSNGSGSNYVNAATGAILNDLYTKIPSEIISSYTDTVTLYAKWNPKIYAITLSDLMGNGSGTIYEKYGVGFFSDSDATNQITSITVPTLTGYDFDGFYPLQNGGGGSRIISTSGSILKANTYFTANTTIHAYYVPAIYEIGLIDLYCGSGEGTIYEKYGVGFFSDSDATDEITSVDEPYCTGHTFHGYYIFQNGGGNQIIDEDGEIIAGNTLFTSDYDIFTHYTPNSYSCTIGQYLPAGSTSCSTCSTGYYCPSAGTYEFSYSSAQGRTKCPGSMTSNSGSTLKTDCKITCASTKYLAAGASACTDCAAGSFCTGATCNYSDSSSCGITPCATGSYSSGTGNSSCTVCQASGAAGANGTTSGSGQTSCNTSCNKSHASTWETSSWNNNSPTNICTIKTCESGYSLSNNTCVVNTKTVTIYGTPTDTITISFGGSTYATKTIGSAGTVSATVPNSSTSNVSFASSLTSTTRSLTTSSISNVYFKRYVLMEGTSYFGKDSASNWTLKTSPSGYTVNPNGMSSGSSGGRSFLKGSGALWNGSERQGWIYASSSKVALSGYTKLTMEGYTTVCSTCDYAYLYFGFETDKSIVGSQASNYGGTFGNIPQGDADNIKTKTLTFDATTTSKYVLFLVMSRTNQTQTNYSHRIYNLYLTPTESSS